MEARHSVKAYLDQKFANIFKSSILTLKICLFPDALSAGFRYWLSLMNMLLPGENPGMPGIPPLLGLSTWSLMMSITFSCTCLTIRLPRLPWPDLKRPSTPAAPLLLPPPPPPPDRLDAAIPMMRFSSRCLGELFLEASAFCVALISSSMAVMHGLSTWLPIAVGCEQTSQEDWWEWLSCLGDWRNGLVVLLIIRKWKWSAENDELR